MAEILKVNETTLKLAVDYGARQIKIGKVIAFPTDTFYALGADPLNLAAVNEVFRVKGRDAARPLPLLVESVDQAAEFSGDLPQLFFKLAGKYWPGPLTMVVPAAKGIPLKVTGNTGNIGLRVPNMPLVLALVRAAGRPVTGTSANLTEHTPCVTAEEVEAQVGGSVQLILDGGACVGGLASTVVDLTGVSPRILRQGKIPSHELEELFG
jgi:L-threonylcarbamoyladenylate synthase